MTYLTSAHWNGKSHDESLIDVYDFSCFLCAWEATQTNGFPQRPVVVSSRTLAVPSSQHRHLQHRWGIPKRWRKQEGKSIGNGKVRKKLIIYVENMIIHTVWLLFDLCDKGVDVFWMFLLEGNVAANLYRFLGCSFGKPCPGRHIDMFCSS